MNWPLTLGSEISGL